MKLTYWISECECASVYNIRRETKKAVIAELFRLENDLVQDISDYSEPRKVTLEYDNAFDLLELCSNESHHWWESVNK